MQIKRTHYIKEGGNIEGFCKKKQFFRKFIYKKKPYSKEEGAVRLALGFHRAIIQARRR